MIVSIIIVNWNSKDYVRQCLASLFTHCRTVEYEVVVVDSGSFDGCHEMLAHEFPAVRFVQSPENIGFARANNLGVRHATGTSLLFLNPDTLLLEDSVRIMLDALGTLPQAGAVCCRLLNADHTLQTSCVQAFPTVVNQMLDSEYLRQRFSSWRMWGTAALFALPPRSVAVEAVSGACLFVARECFERAGGFTETYFMYGEDLDLCFKIHRAGFKIYYVPATQLVHLGGGSSRQAASNFSNVMMRASVHRFIRTHRGRGAAFAYRLSTALVAVVRLLFIGPLMILGNHVVRHGIGSLRKWLAILRWSIGLERTTAAPASTASLPPT